MYLLCKTNCIQHVLQVSIKLRSIHSCRRKDANIFSLRYTSCNLFSGFHYYENRLSFYVTYDIKSQVITLFMIGNLGNRSECILITVGNKIFETLTCTLFSKMKIVKTSFYFSNFKMSSAIGLDCLKSKIFLSSPHRNFDRKKTLLLFIYIMQ